MVPTIFWGRNLPGAKGLLVQAFPHVSLTVGQFFAGQNQL